jgi:hypothetical protein
MTGQASVKGAQRMAGYVFISYAREDKPYVKGLEAQLADRDIECWWDKKLHTGEYFQARIRAVIRSCAAMIVIGSEHVERSAWVSREVAYATGLRKPVLPLRVDGNEIPLVIAPIAYEDVRTYQMPSEEFFARVRQYCAEHDVPLPAVARDEPPLPPVGSTPLTWLPYELSGCPHTFQVEDGIITSWTLDGQPRARHWGNLGADVTRIVTTQDGAHLVIQTEAGLTIAEVDTTGSLRGLARYPLGADDRLVAARRPERAFPAALQVLVSGRDFSRIISFDHDWAYLRSLADSLPYPVFGGAGLDDGFLVIGLDSVLTRLAADGEQLSSFGPAWLDVDVALTESGPTVAGLRRAGAAVMMRTASSVADLDGAATELDGDVRAVRLVRQRGRSLDTPNACPITSAGRPLTPFRGLPG